MSATATRQATLPRAREIAAIRDAMDGANGLALRNLAADLRWAQLDRSREIAADSDVRALAVELAAAGDEDALAALALAATLAPVPEPQPDQNDDTRLDRALRNGFEPSAIFGQMRASLSEHRRADLPFDEAWGLALHELEVEGLWRAVLASTREAWKAAYERTTAPPGYHLLPPD